MKVIAITQARIGSSRLPEKVLLNVGKDSLLGLHLKRLSKAKKLNKIIVATTHEVGSHKICEIAETLSIACFKGSLDDVLDRFYQAAIKENPDYIVRITSDCPLIDPKLLDEVIERAKAEDLDYYANILEEFYPDGQDIEVFKFSALEKAWKEATLKSEREHVTSYIRNNSSYKGGILFKSNNHGLDDNYNHVRLTVDEPQDLEVIRHLVRELGFDKDWKTYADYYLRTPEIRELNGQIIRNEGYQKSINLEKD